MKFTIDQIEILSSKAGDGITVGDKIIGCAVIRSIRTENGKLDKFIFGNLVREGLCAKYRVAEGEDGEFLVLDIEGTDLGNMVNGNNYVLFIKDKTSGEVTTVLNTLDITRLFQLDDEDAVIMAKYLGALANQKSLILQEYTDIDSGQTAMFFVNQLDREIIDLILDDKGIEATNSYKHMLSNQQYMVDMTTHSFIKTFLMSTVKSCQDRYNTVHRLNVIKEIAEKVSGITYWDDGIMKSPSVRDVCDYLKEAERFVRIKQ